ncbi:TRM2 tRNA methyltransferase 2-like protein A [Dimargaris cristalligena]|uniref:TRM2 tRNA methyltransferase 2-like protein A n=1 Tax=Dimargaris cristalligena TaxID=215637 RepID=A0A4Q0A249_9FUNG|nr:TRM2 tRNA methyltransferase 2-like protein A [Dimargaris cristalligena]|eukprot:RKP40206.1 TRM2 tRNA methyltransferase 2-like protein A [Dimargaris cristalligena]
MQDYTRERTDLPVYSRIDKTGVWRLFVTRTLESGQNMVIVQYNPTGLDEATIEKVHADLVERFSKGTPTVHSLYIQQSDSKSVDLNPTIPFQLIYGVPHIHENLLNLQFRISPSSFFQANTPAAEKLYTIIRRWAMGQAEPAPSDAVLLDLCCGTGTIGLSMASAFRKVVGIETIPAAIEDAQINAAVNKVENAEFFVGRVEDTLPKQLERLNQEALERGQPTSVVAVLDPPRAGLDRSAIQAVRACRSINRVVFVACDFAASLQNVVDLCRPTTNKFAAHPFRPVQAVPVDLFPDTKHCELVIELVRDYIPAPARTVPAALP